MTATLRALLVEDSPEDAELLRRELTRAGLSLAARRVDSAPDFTKAIDGEPWDVVLSDYTMPGFGGKAALQILQERALDIPFIIVSGSLGEDVAVDVMKAGAHDYFAKGRTVRLPAAIEREVREARLRRERVAERQRSDAEREALLAGLRAALETRDEFLAIASHELRTPLTGLQLHVQGLARLCGREAAAPVEATTLEAKVKAMSRQVGRLKVLVNNLLNVSRITSGETALALESFAFDELLGDVLQACKEAVEPDQPVVEVDAQHVTGTWDRLRVETIVSNLISNAIKFGGRKPISVRLRGEGRCAILSVTDRGFGIPAAAQARIFEKFERAVPSEHYGGFGLGLWIVRQLVNAHGGTVAVQSREGRGSTFTVTLPLGAES